MNESTSISNEDDDDELSQSFNPLYISNKNDNQLTFASIRFSTRNWTFEESFNSFHSQMDKIVSFENIYI